MTKLLVLALLLHAQAPAAEDRDFHWVHAVVTAYCGTCPMCCPGGHGITSTGKNLNHGFLPGVAADPRALAYHTHVRIAGYGEVEVDDTGAAMRHDWDRAIVHLDVRMPSHELARQFGRKWMWVRVYDD
jgi:3D (Asp-Asp-Asp) domain-containing protein